ncbi:MAG: 3-phosphoshikimate 1-carboxyvinyltransferase [Candidatus Marinimicrobia bacterium]|nr:3-phosphoshikimate 1-carboxyvinyltransferase [Candidatus Neomarinimicrobiota bacterium]
MADVFLSKLEQMPGEMTVPGDKSISHRVAMIGSIAEGVSVIKNFSSAIDCCTTINCMRKLGVDIRESGSDFVIQGKGPDSLQEPVDVLDCGNSGTSIRLLCGLLAGQNFPTILTGDDSLRSRPMARIMTPLNENGADLRGRQNNRFAPIYINGKRLTAIGYHLPVASAQVKSALLLAGLYTNGKVEIVEPITSRDHTERLLEFCDVDVLKGKQIISLGPNRRPKARNFVVPGDLSSAAFPIALALLLKNAKLKIRDVGINPSRTGFLDVLQTMGAEIQIENRRLQCNEPIGDIVTGYSKLSGIEVGGKTIPLMIDELPLLAVVATQATGRTVIKDAGELRVKESDRISAIVKELKKMGASIEESSDGFIVEGPTPLHGTSCASHGDHRIAMALSVAGWIADGETIIGNAECVDISFPEFYKLMI